MILSQVIPVDVIGKNVKVLSKVSSELNRRWSNWNISLTKEQLCQDSCVRHFGDFTVNVKVKVKWCKCFEQQRKKTLTRRPPGLQSVILGIFLWKFKNASEAKAWIRESNDGKTPVGNFGNFSLSPKSLLRLRWPNRYSAGEQLTIIVTTKDTIAMIPDYHQEKPNVVSAYDFIVVGAGSSGFVKPRN